MRAAAWCAEIADSLNADKNLYINLYIYLIPPKAIAKAIAFSVCTGRLLLTLELYIGRM